MRDLTVEQHSTWNGLALNHPYRATTMSNPVIQHVQHALRCLCLVSEPFSYPLMSACCSLRSCSPFKTVLNKLGDSYQTYINTYQTHAMATCHRGTGQPLERVSNPPEQDTDIPSEHHHEVMDNFENVEHENHTTLETLTRELDHL